jgi:hypothetical protein
MSNVKIDMLEELKRDKKYLEMELAGLAQNAIMSYKEKIEKMTDTLKQIAVVNGSFGLLDVYFQTQEEQLAAQQQQMAAQEQAAKEPVVEQPKEEPKVVNEPVVEQPVMNEVKGDDSPFPKIN